MHAEISAEEMDGLAYMARLAENDEVFVAWALRRYRGCHGLSTASLAAYLGCPAEALPRLALSPRPNLAARRFAEDVRRLAAVTGCDPVRLMVLLGEAHLAGVAEQPARAA